MLIEKYFRKRKFQTFRRIALVWSTILVMSSISFCCVDFWRIETSKVFYNTQYPIQNKYEKREKKVRYMKE